MIWPTGEVHIIHYVHKLNMPYTCSRGFALPNLNQSKIMDINFGVLHCMTFDRVLLRPAEQVSSAVVVLWVLCLVSTLMLFHIGKSRYRYWLDVLTVAPSSATGKREIWAWMQDQNKPYLWIWCCGLHSIHSCEHLPIIINLITLDWLQYSLSIHAFPP